MVQQSEIFFAQFYGPPLILYQYLCISRRVSFRYLPRKAKVQFGSSACSDTATHATQAHSLCRASLCHIYEKGLNCRAKKSSLSEVMEHMRDKRSGRIMNAIRTRSDTAQIALAALTSFSSLSPPPTTSTPSNGSRGVWRPFEFVE